MNILLVEDDTEYRAVLTSCLECMEHTVATAFDYDSAMNQFHRLKPDLVITDFNYPGGGGIALLGTIRTSEDLELRNIPALVISGSSTLEIGSDNQRKIAEMAQGFLTKPVDTDVLLDTIKNVTSSTIRHDTRPSPVVSKLAR